MDTGRRFATYDPKNLRYRKASIRDRLAEIKVEREALIEERDAIDRKLKSEAAELNGSAKSPISVSSGRRSASESRS